MLPRTEERRQSGRQDAGQKACARRERGGVAGRARVDASRLRGRNVRKGALSKEQGHRPLPGNSLKKLWKTGPSYTLMYLHRPYLVSSEKVTPRRCIIGGGTAHRFILCDGATLSLCTTCGGWCTACAERQPVPVRSFPTEGRRQGVLLTGSVGFHRQGPAELPNKG